MKKFKSGFTLAEVLITLGIIGVVASIIMPSVMTNYTYKVVGVRLAKFASQLEGSTRPFVVQNESFSKDNNSLNINTYLEESFILKDTDLAKQSISVKGTDDKDEKIEVTSMVILDGSAPVRGSSDTGWTSSDGSLVGTDNLLNIKDGTSMIAYPLSTAYTNDEIDPYKVGEAVWGITFSPNVKGLPTTAQKSFDFVITDLGYVFPNRTNDKCIASIYDADYTTNASMFKEGTACARANNDSSSGS